LCLLSIEFQLKEWGIFKYGKQFSEIIETSWKQLFGGTMSDEIRKQFIPGGTPLKSG